MLKNSSGRIIRTRYLAQRLEVEIHLQKLTYPDTPLAFQVPYLLLRVAKDFLDAAFLIVERIDNPSERQNLKDEILKLQNSVNLQWKVVT